MHSRSTGGGAAGPSPFARNASGAGAAAPPPGEEDADAPLTGGAAPSASAPLAGGRGWAAPKKWYARKQPSHDIDDAELLDMRHPGEAPAGGAGAGHHGQGQGHKWRGAGSAGGGTAYAAAAPPPPAALSSPSPLPLPLAGAPSGARPLSSLGGRASSLAGRPPPAWRPGAHARRRACLRWSVALGAVAAVALAAGLIAHGVQRRQQAAISAAAAVPLAAGPGVEGAAAINADGTVDLGTVDAPPGGGAPDVVVADETDVTPRGAPRPPPRAPFLPFVRGGSGSSGSGAAGADSATAATGGLPLITPAEDNPRGAAAAAPSPLPSPAPPPVPPGCEGLRLENHASPEVNLTNGAITLNGTTYVVNASPSVVALTRVGVRLCSSATNVGHLRATADCPTNDVPAGGSIVCAWSVALPAPGPGAPGAKLAAWRGILRWDLGGGIG